MSRYFATGDEDQHQPVMWLRGYPVYAAHFIVLVFVVSMVITTLLFAFKASALLSWLTFTSDEVLKGQIWRVFTYGLVNPPTLQFVIDMFMIGWFGRELEKFFGRRRFLLLYGCLYLLSPVLFTVIGVWRPMGPLAGETGAFALFIAFATLYPGVALLFGILAQWLAIILVAIFTLMAIASGDFMGLLSLWVTVGFAYAFVRHQQGRFTLPSIRLPTRQPKLRVLPVPEKPVSPSQSAKNNAMAEVDALLDKIAQSGIASLTAKERARLDEARERLRKNQTGSR